ncbi:MAG: carbohydrate-binding family 9-like protein [Fibrobacteraceae bacterium]|nr:carbohydrate-binding family 9-like protein [Fibrobacteraceae bacterium]
MLLHPNRIWESAPDEDLPEVFTRAFKNGQFLEIYFKVKEPVECYSSSMTADGGRAWEESCVEVFVKALDNSEDYLNFEFTSRGYCFAARGKNRWQRKELLASQYSRILRSANEIINDGKYVSWNLHVSIPSFILGKNSTLDGVEIFGNLYKCADKSRRPHYLSLFPICTPKPDFHQPRFFKKLA